MTARGFSLIELLLAMAITLAMAGTIATLARPMSSLAERSAAAGDAAQRARAGVEMLVRDLREAGSGSSLAPVAVRLADLIPVVVPMSSLDGGSAAPFGAVRVVRVARNAPQAITRAAAAAGDALLLPAADDRCYLQDSVCGFAPGMTLVIHDSTRVEWASVNQVFPASRTISVSPPLAADFAAGATLAVVETVDYGLRDAPDALPHIVRISGGGAEQPVVDGVVFFNVHLQSAKLIEIRLRTAAQSSALRGPAGPLFVVAGIASDSRHWVPDLELRIAIAIRSQ